MQKPFDDDHQRRVRYNGSLLTANIVDPGDKFQNIPDVCMVYIAKLDIFGDDLNIYHVKRIIDETKKLVFNGYEEIYVNAVCSNRNNDIGQLMQVFVDDNAYNEKFPVTSSLKNRLKNSEEEVEKMSSIIERFYGDELKEAREEAKKEGKIEGMKEMGNNISILLRKLIDENRTDDIKRISEDYQFRDKLLNEMFSQQAN